MPMTGRLPHPLPPRADSPTPSRFDRRSWMCQRSGNTCAVIHWARPSSCCGRVVPPQRSTSSRPIPPRPAVSPCTRTPCAISVLTPRPSRSMTSWSATTREHPTRPPSFSTEARSVSRHTSTTTRQQTLRGPRRFAPRAIPRSLRRRGRPSRRRSGERANGRKLPLRQGRSPAEAHEPPEAPPPLTAPAPRLTPRGTSRW